MKCTMPPCTYLDLFCLSQINATKPDTQETILNDKRQRFNLSGAHKDQYADVKYIEVSLNPEP